MNYIQTEIDGVWLIEPKVFHDARGYFMEAFKEEEFRAHVGNVHFIQDNESKSSFGVLRGLHYQKGDCSHVQHFSLNDTYQFGLAAITLLVMKTT